MIVLLTRGSPLALRQAEISAAILAGGALPAGIPPAEATLKTVVTQGDRKLEWALEKAGGKGLFTVELENALVAGGGDIAVHSAKDLPAQLAAGTALAGFLKRANPADVLVRRADVPAPRTIATGSPRRRAQARAIFPNAAFCELRGNVATRLGKIAAGTAGADATFLAAAGLERLGIREFPGLVFEEWGIEKMVPAAGQAAIAWQTRTGDAVRFAPLCDAGTTLAISIEREFLRQLGEGCHTAFAAHFSNAADTDAAGTLHIFHESFGRKTFPFTAGTVDAAGSVDAAGISAEVRRIIRSF